jgi:hypothetical protein
MAKVKIQLKGLPHVQISLLDDQGRLPKRSGLNLGQRPEYNRNPDEAYIRVPKRVDDLGFFPDPGIRFTIHTDDNKTLTCTRAQANAKAIETPDDNSLMGQYFRRRLGLASRALVRKKDLLSYGRTDVDFYKINNRTYYMDFSK